MTSRTEAIPECESPGLPHGLRRARLYPSGWLCNLHCPCARRGLPEISPGPGWPPGNYLAQQHDELEHQEDTDDDSRATPDTHPA